MPTFTLNGKVLENVNTYKYVGIILHKNGKFAKTTKENIAIHMLKQILGYSINAPVKLSMPLFDKQITPIYMEVLYIYGVYLTIINIFT